ncbi:SulP family inorganic anion transporter, partial [uncultured Desulfovibrio sp.]
VGAIPSVVPPLSLPPAFDLDALRDLFMPALALALLGTVESLAIGKQLANVKNDSFDGSQELIGQGLGNLAAGLTSGIPGCGSFTRSALMVSSGGRTRMGTVFSGILALPMLFLLAPLIRWLPLPALGGILLLISFKMIDVEAIRLCLVATRVDRVVLLITFLSTLLFDLEKAIFIGVLLSLVLFIYKTSHPRVRRLQPGDPLLREAPADLPDGVAVYVIEGTLFFGAIHELERQLYEEDREPARLVLLHLSRVFWLDASGAHALAQFVERCYARSMPVILVVGSSSVRNILQRTGILDYLSNGFVADTINEGLRLAATLLRRVSCRDGQCAFPMPAMPAWRDDQETDPLLSAGEAGAAAGLAPTQADQLPGPLRSAPGNAAANAAQARSNEPAPARSTPAAEARVTLTGPQPPAGGPAHPASEDAAASVVSAAPSADGPADFVPAPQPTSSPTAAPAPPAGRKSGSDPKELA